MEQLKVIGTEEGVLVLATESGDRFSLRVDETLRAQLRRAHTPDEPRVAKPGPREIQGHIRAGLSAEEVAEILGIRVEDVQKYERPVLAEREHIVGQALAVPVLMGGELEPDAQPTFGAAVRAKLAEAGAVGERWTSWRESTGWIVKLEFTANEVDHDARWSFDPRRSTLSPQNADATQLSRQGSLPEGLIPRLRALDVSPFKDSSRFDSGAFGPRRPAVEPEADLPAPDVRMPVAPAVQEAAIKRAPDRGVTSAETADLLEALRRRRGQREPMPAEEPPADDRGPVALFDAIEPDPEPQPEQSDETTTIDTGRRSKGRTSMPSWDEIVFGARTEDA
jgi:hypothetical protein